MSGVATQLPPAGPPGPQEPPPSTNGGGHGPEAPETNGGPPPPASGHTNGPSHGQPGRGPASAATAAHTQKMLDENSSLISTISEYQKLGRHNETTSYQVHIQGVPKKTLFCVLLAIITLWKGLEIKVEVVLKTSGNSQCNRHRNFPN